MTKERRDWLMVFAALTASITYSAALNPPGGMWSADDATKGYAAGFPILLDKNRSRYFAFYYLNATSFLSSVCIIALLSIDEMLLEMIRGRLVLDLLVALNLAAMVGAFIAGSLSPLTVLIVDVIVAGLVLLLFGALILFWTVVKKAGRDFCHK